MTYFLSKLTSYDHIHPLQITANLKSTIDKGGSKWRNHKRTRDNTSREIKMKTKPKSTPVAQIKWCNCHNVVYHVMIDHMKIKPNLSHLGYLLDVLCKTSKHKRTVDAFIKNDANSKKSRHNIDREKSNGKQNLSLAHKSMLLQTKEHHWCETTWKSIYILECSWWAGGRYD